MSAWKSCLTLVTNCQRPTICHCSIHCQSPWTRSSNGHVCVIWCSKCSCTCWFQKLATCDSSTLRFVQILNKPVRPSSCYLRCTASVCMSQCCIRRCCSRQSICTIWNLWQRHLISVSGWLSRWCAFDTDRKRCVTSHYVSFLSYGPWIRCSHCHITILWWG